MTNKCELCGGRGLESFEGGYAGFCRECYGFGTVIDAPIIEYCQFGFFTAKLEKAWERTMDVMQDEPEEADGNSCCMVEE